MKREGKAADRDKQLIFYVSLFLSVYTGTAHLVAGVKSCSVCFSRLKERSPNQALLKSSEGQLLSWQTHPLSLGSVCEQH